MAHRGDCIVSNAGHVSGRGGQAVPEGSSPGSSEDWFGRIRAVGG